MASAIPVVLMFINWTVCLIMYVSGKKTTLYSGFQSSLLLLYSIHPYIVKAGVALISCKAIETRTLWLTADVSLQCWQTEHSFIVLTLFLPMFLIYILGVPMAVFVSVFRLCKSVMSGVMTFFTAGYRPTSRLWEVVICLRKTLLILVLGLLGSSESVVQILSAMVALYSFLEWHIREAPFEHKFHNMLEGSSLFLQLVLTGFSFYFISSLHILDTILEIISYTILLLVLGFILASLLTLLAQIILSRRKKTAVQPVAESPDSQMCVPPPSYNSSSVALMP